MDGVRVVAGPRCSEEAATYSFRAGRDRASSAIVGFPSLACTGGADKFRTERALGARELESVGGWR